MRSGIHRERLPKTRKCVTHQNDIGGHTISVSFGEYKDGRCGEIFIDLGKEGSDVAGWANAFAIAVSLGIQHGIPVSKFVHTFKGMKFGFHDDESTSIPDLVMRRLEEEYAKSEAGV